MLYTKSSTKNIYPAQCDRSSFYNICIFLGGRLFIVLFALLREIEFIVYTVWKKLQSTILFSKYFRRRVTHHPLGASRQFDERRRRISEIDVVDFIVLPFLLSIGPRWRCYISRSSVLFCSTLWGWSLSKMVPGGQGLFVNRQSVITAKMCTGDRWANSLLIIRGIVRCLLPPAWKRIFRALIGKRDVVSLCRTMPPGTFVYVSFCPPRNPWIVVF